LRKQAARTLFSSDFHPAFIRLLFGFYRAGVARPLIFEPFSAARKIHALFFTLFLL
jgi:hypothetical protein